MSEASGGASGEGGLWMLEDADTVDASHRTVSPPSYGSSVDAIMRTRHGSVRVLGWARGLHVLE